MENQLQKTTKNEVAVERNITDGVLARVNQLTQKNELVLPKNYSVENALKFAYLDLKANGLLGTDKDALAASLLNMCVQGLSPQKKQCYFINFGGKVNLMRSYHGDRAVAILAGLVKDFQAYIIYQGDEVNINYAPETNYLEVEHKTKFENWDKPIIGAYAVAIMPDGTKRYDLMTIERIRKSWNMSSNKNNNKLQTEFITEACKRTVTRHLVKELFNQTNDESLLINNVLENEQSIEANSKAEKDADFTYDSETGVVEAQEEESGTITPEFEEEKPMPQEEKKPTQQSIFDKYNGSQNDNKGIDF